MYWNNLHRPNSCSFNDSDLELTLHTRYLALRLLGWHEVVWCEAGAYYLPNTPAKPDFSDKRRITLAKFETLLTCVELRYAKSASTIETSEVNQTVSSLRRA
jgi:hypothetical protein